MMMLELREAARASLRSDTGLTSAGRQTERPSNRSPLCFIETMRSSKARAIPQDPLDQLLDVVHAHAARTFEACRLSEQALERRVMQINAVLVGKFIFTKPSEFSPWGSWRKL